MQKKRNKAEICIYCKQGDKEFSTEHVIPKSFGTFENNMTIHDVCRDCNTGFGKRLDLVLARDSWEGIMRAKYKEIKKKQEAFRHSRIKFKVTSQELGGKFKETDGFYVSYDLNTKKAAILPQVLIFNDKTNKYEVFFERDFKSKSKHIKELGNKLKIITPEEKSFKILCQHVKKLGKSYPRKPKMFKVSNRQSKEALFSVEGVIDELVCRALAKIAFNYLAFNLGSDFALKDNFDEIRDFIRGKIQISPFSLVKIIKEPILADESQDRRWFDGHLILLENGYANPDLIASKLSLFNSVTYLVLLTDKPLQIWRKIQYGHGFNVRKRKIHKLTGVNKKLIPAYFINSIQSQLHLFKKR